MTNHSFTRFNSRFFFSFYNNQNRRYSFFMASLELFDRKGTFVSHMRCSLHIIQHMMYDCCRAVKITKRNSSTTIQGPRAVFSCPGQSESLKTWTENPIYFGKKKSCIPRNYAASVCHGTVCFLLADRALCSECVVRVRSKKQFVGARVLTEFPNIGLLS